jgi:LacI family transcriptional regulator
MAPRIPRVALLIETSRAYGRGLLRGVRRYLQDNGPWSVFFQPRGLGEPPPSWLTSWRGDGILVRADTRRLARAVQACGVPTVELRFSFDDLGWPTVGIKQESVIQLALRHLLDHGLRHFAFCGLPTGENIWADYREKCFHAEAAGVGHYHGCFPDRRCRRRPSAEDEQQAMAEWLAALPRPVGVLACNDDRGLEVLEACRRAGLHVPDEVAVIGVDNDEMLCGLSDPPLSSVDVGVERAGYEAAALLDRLMKGRPPPRKQLFLEPYGVVVRRSTEILKVDDPELEAMIRTIRARACEGIRVEDVIGDSGLSASTLNRRFHQLLGRGPKEEITRVRMEQAKRLLAETEQAVAEVAARCGFAELKHFSRAFRAWVGKTPSAYRREARKTSGR